MRTRRGRHSSADPKIFRFAPIAPPFVWPAKILLAIMRVEGCDKTKGEDGLRNCNLHA